MDLKFVNCIIALTLCTSNIYQCVASAVNRRPSRKVDDLTKIARGRDVEIEDYPYIVSLQVMFRHVCGGSLIHPLWVLTAGHCVCHTAITQPYTGLTRDPSEFTVVAGLSIPEASQQGSLDNDPNRRKVIEIVCHEEYASANDGELVYWNDIALLMLNSSFGKELSVQVVCLPPQNFDEPADCETIGWGFQTQEEGKAYNSQPRHLKAVDIILTNRSYCAKEEFKTILLEDYQLCADTRESTGGGICLGDSGGPLVNDDVLLGISSYINASEVPCSLNPYAVFTRVAKYQDWLSKHVPQFDDPKCLSKNIAARTFHLEQAFIILFMFMDVLLM